MTSTLPGSGVGVGVALNSSGGAAGVPGRVAEVVVVVLEVLVITGGPSD